MPAKLAIEGGRPVRKELLPYSRQWVDDDDIEAVVGVLCSDFLTTGPKIKEFEDTFKQHTSANGAVALSSGTAALHAAASAAGIRTGDEVIVPAMTFAATANCVLFMGGLPVFADVNSDTLLVDPDSINRLVSPRTRAIIAVDYAGQPCRFDSIREIASRAGCVLIDDACHALGAKIRGRPAGSWADLSVFSFHPVKHITTGEGGMVTGEDAGMIEKIRHFRNHGITRDHSRRALENTWYYEMQSLGYNYRMTDFQAALGLSQLRKLDRWLKRRREIAARYDEAFDGCPLLRPLKTRPEVEHARHLYVVRLDLTRLRVDRAMVFRALRSEGIGVNIHYLPVYLHPYYRNQLGTGPGLCPHAEAAYEEMLSLPLFPRMSAPDVEDVVTAVKKVVEAYAL